MKSSRKLWPLLVMVTGVALLSLGCPAPDPVIIAGTDCWETDPAGTVWSPKSAIPAGFFTDKTVPDAPMSNAIPPPQFPADFSLRGGTLDADEIASCNCPAQVETTVTWLNRHGEPTDDIRHKVSEVVDTTAAFDTCIHREANATFKGQGAAVKVDIELVQLSLESVAPLEVTYQDESTKLFDAVVTEGDTQKKGSMTFTANKVQKGKADGDMVLGKLPIHFEVVFVAQDGSFTTDPITGTVDFKDTVGEFTQIAP